MNKISELIPDPLNANRGTERGREMLEKSLRQYGAGRSILLDKHGRIIAGNKTAQTAIEIGLDDLQIVETDGKRIVAVKRMDLDLETDDDARAMAYADNRVGQVDLDFDPLQLIMDKDAGKLPDFWTDEELAELVGAETAPVDPADDPGADVDAADELQEKWQTETGQIWTIGEHRLMCGDSTSGGDVALLMNGETAHMMFTDPPYGVGYSGGHLNEKESKKIKGDADATLYAAFLPRAFDVVDGPCYMWFADSKGADVYGAVTENLAEIHALLIWHKTNATYAAMGAQYKQRHEPCLYFKPKGSTLRWCGESTENTMWEIARDAQNDMHPTQKPIALALRAMGNHEANLIVDFFCGSGSTMVAAEQLGRKCYGMEIDPKYCAVILERMQGMGLEPQLNA